MTRHARHGGSPTRGFTLVEVLVSLVILSIGLLGMAKLMLFSSRSNDSAYLRSQATALAYEILDNMRANRQEAINVGSYTTAATAAAANPGFTCIGTVPCNATQLALFDVYQWKLRLATPTGALPGGQGSVLTNTVGSQTTVTIQVLWDDSVAAGAVGNQSVTLETVL